MLPPTVVPTIKSAAAAMLAISTTLRHTSAQHVSFDFVRRWCHVSTCLFLGHSSCYTCSDGTYTGCMSCALGYNLQSGVCSLCQAGYYATGSGAGFACTSCLLQGLYDVIMDSCFHDMTFTQVLQRLHTVRYAQLLHVCSAATTMA